MFVNKTNINMERVLSSRTVDCKNIGIDEFVKAIRNDFIVAQETYNDHYCEQYVNNSLKSHKMMVNSTRKNAKEYAERKWKTQKKRDAYMENVEMQISKMEFKDPYFENLTWFDVKLDPSAMSVSAFIEEKYMSDSNLEKLYNVLMESDWFKKALGWKFIINTSDHKGYEWSYTGRPHFELILSEEDAEKYRKAEKDLAESVNNFYKGCRYWGD